MRLNTKISFLLIAILTLPISITLTGCGVKPSQVDPPPGAEDSPFPRTYPDTSYDPPPTGGPPPF